MQLSAAKEGGRANLADLMAPFKAPDPNIDPDILESLSWGPPKRCDFVQLPGALWVSLTLAVTGDSSSPPPRAYMLSPGGGGGWLYKKDIGDI